MKPITSFLSPAHGGFASFGRIAIRFGTWAVLFRVRSWGGCRDFGFGRGGDWGYFSVAGLRFPPFFDRPESSLLRAKPRWNGPATPPP